MVKPIGVPQLMQACSEVVHFGADNQPHKGPIDRFITNYRSNEAAKYNVDREGLKGMLESLPLWKKPKQGSGDLAFKHKVTGIVVGFQGHCSSNKKQSTLPPKQAESVLDLFQKHVNILGNEIFGYVTENWKTVPNFEDSLTRYTRWKASLSAS